MFTYLANPQATLEELSQTAAALGVEITPEGLTQRFTAEAATFLQEVLAAAVTRTLAADPLAIPLLARFAGVYLEDSTSIVLPDALRDRWAGCGNATGQGRAALKINLRLDLCTGRLASLTLHDGRMHDSAASAPLRAVSVGALYLADLGSFGLDRFQELSQHGASFVSRLKASTQVYGPDGQRWGDLAARLERQGTHVDLPVTLGETHRLPARLLAVRVPQEGAHGVVHDRRHRLTPGCLPVFTRDGLTLYVYALSAHVGQWVRGVGQRRRQWHVMPGLIDGQVKQTYRRRKVVRVTRVMRCGRLEDLRAALRTLGLSGRLKTACVERVNLCPEGAPGREERPWRAGRGQRPKPAHRWLSSLSGGAATITLCASMRPCACRVPSQSSDAVGACRAAMSNERQRWQPN